MRMTSARLRRIIAVAVAAVVATASAAAQTPGFPYVDKNCGYDNTYAAAPQRAVTLSNNATELMLALGLEGRMAGTSYMANLKISPQYERAYATVPNLSPLVATTEQLIAVRADFVYAGYPDGFAPARHTRDQLHDLGMKTRLNTEGCNLGPVSFDTLYDEIRALARIFGVPERGETLIGGLAARLATVRKAVADAKPVPVFIYNGGEAAPNAALGHTMLNDIVKQAGGANIFASVANRYGNVSWEQVAEREPEYIVVFYSGTDAGLVVEDPATKLGKARVAVLNANPTIRNVPAIKNQKFVLIDSIRGQPGPSSMDAVEEFARAFHPQAFAK
jgi:iron complex transport system substrate-binding protein